MTQTSSSLVLSVDEFLTRYGDNPRYELADGELIDMEPTGLHETTAGKIASQLSIEIDRQGHPWIIPRICLLRPFADIATARRPDVVVLDEPALVHEPLWEREPVITLGASVKLVVEVVSTNWETDYARKLEDYETMGIPEYWIADYLGLGGTRYVGKPKQPTFSVYVWIDGTYQVKQFRGSDRIESPTFPNLTLIAEQIFQVGQ